MSDVTHGTTWMPGIMIMYIDDLLIHFQTHKQHMATLDMVMNLIPENHMKINFSKCFFFQTTQVSYLVFRLPPKEIKMGKDKLKAVETTKVPSTQAFCGAMNFFRTHIEEYVIL
jgi:hypothetical protein